MSCVLLVAGRKLSRLAVDLIAIATALGLTGLLGYLLATSAGGRIVSWAAGWSPHHGYSVGIVFVVDPLGAGIALLACCLMAVAFLYSVRYLDAVEAHYHCLMLLFLAGMIGFSLTGDLFDLFVFFELMGAAAYGLTAIVVEDESALQGGINFGIVNSLGAYFSLAGLGLLFARTGSVGLPQLHDALVHQRPNALIVAAFVLVLVGFLVKGAMVPFHFWLADAHAVAPAPVCLLFSGVMVPLGIYGVFRIYWTVFAPVLPMADVRRTFIVLGAVTAILGAVMALSQRHFKRLLAYSTIAHVGLFLVALACLSVSGTAGALLYVAGHAAVKGALFLIAGVMLAQYGSVDEYDLFGRGTGDKLIGVALVIGALGLAGLPPFGTALGKALSEEAGTAAGYPWVPVLFVAVSALTGAAVLRVAGRVYFGLGPKPIEWSKVRSSGSGEVGEPRFERLPWTMGAAIVTPSGRWVRSRLDPRDPQRGQPSRRHLHRLGGIRPPGSLWRRQKWPLHRTPPNWTGLGLFLGFLSALLACLIAGATLYGRRLVDRVLPSLRSMYRPIEFLQRLHSGHVGDYVAWMMMGMTIVAGFVGLPVR